MNCKVALGLVPLVFCLLGAGAACRAQTPQPPQTPQAGSNARPQPPAASASGATVVRPGWTLIDEQAAERPERGEPNVTHTVIEDEGSKIDELRIRGQLQHVIVTPKVGTTKSYEIIVNTSGRSPGNGVPGNTGADGKSVWSVLIF